MALAHRLKGFGLRKLNKAVAVPGLNRDDAYRLRLLLPPVDEQRRIAAVLDQADALRAKRREALTQLDELTQSIFLDMFGKPSHYPDRWGCWPLRDLVKEFRYGTSNKSQPYGVPTLRIPNVVNGVLDTEEIKLVPVTSAELERLRLTDGDLLFVRTNGNPDFVGRCAVFGLWALSSTEYSGQDFIFASYLIRARVDLNRISPIFLREFILGPTARRALRSGSKTSAGQFNINIQSLGATKVPTPPLALQQEFARRVEAVERLKASHWAHLAELDHLFASLQQRAFRGEL